MAREIFTRFKALLMEPSALAYAERHDNIEAIYKKLQDRRDTADVTEVLKELHRIVNEAIRAAAPGSDQAEGLTVDLSRIDFEKLKNEFASKVRRKHAALQDIREVVEKKLAAMLARNPVRMDYYKKYRERLKQASQGLLSSLRDLLAPMPAWLQNATTQAEVKVFILDRLYEALPRPPFTETETEEIAARVYNHVWQQSAAAGIRPQS